jgi:hypothetical protein
MCLGLWARGAPPNHALQRTRRKQRAERDGESLIVLFGGGTKRRQQADIERAKALHAEYKKRKR